MLGLTALLPARRKGEALHAVESEILQEQAGALGRAGLRLDEALDALEKARESLGEIERRLQRREDSSEEEDGLLREAHAKLIGDVGVLRGLAYLAYQFLIIQREAVGVRNHSEVERCYRIAERLL